MIGSPCENPVEEYLAGSSLYSMYEFKWDFNINPYLAEVDEPAYCYQEALASSTNEDIINVCEKLIKQRQ